MTFVKFLGIIFALCIILSGLALIYFDMKSKNRKKIALSDDLHDKDGIPIVPRHLRKFSETSNETETKGQSSASVVDYETENNNPLSMDESTASNNEANPNAVLNQEINNQDATQAPTEENKYLDNTVLDSEDSHTLFNNEANNNFDTEVEFDTTEIDTGDIDERLNAELDDVNHKMHFTASEPSLDESNELSHDTSTANVELEHGSESDYFSSSDNENDVIEVTDNVNSLDNLTTPEDKEEVHLFSKIYEDSVPDSIPQTIPNQVETHQINTDDEVLDEELLVDRPTSTAHTFAFKQGFDITRFTENSPVLDEHLEQTDEQNQNSPLTHATDNLNISILPLNEFSHVNGEKILQMVDDFGFKYGAMNMFHRYQDKDGSGVLWFSMMALTKEGIQPFDLNSLPTTMDIKGLVMFLPLPHPKVLQGFDSMMSIAGLMAREINGFIVDEDGNEITTEYKKKLRALLQSTLVENE